MHWLDVFILILLSVYVWQGWQKGLFVLLAELFSWLLAWFIGGLLAGPVAQALVRYGKLPSLLAFLLAFFVAILLVEQAFFKALEAVASKVERQFLPGKWQHIVGSLITLSIGILFFSFVLLLILQLPLEDWGLAELRQSYSSNLVVQYASFMERFWTSMGWGGWFL